MVDDIRPTFDETFRAEYADIVRVVAPIVGSVDDAEAIVQEAFLKAFTRWRRVGRYDRPGAWVQRVAIRDAVRAARRGRRRPPIEGTPPDGVATAAARLDVGQALRALPPRQRAAVVLHHLADWPVAEVATALGCAEPTVRVHLHRGRQALAARPELEPEETDGRR